MDYVLAHWFAKFFSLTKWFWITISVPFIFIGCLKDKSSFRKELRLFIDCFKYGD